MSNSQEYVQPPKSPKKPKVSKNDHSGSHSEGIYANLHPSYKKRKLVHLIVVAPVVLIIYSLLLASFSLGNYGEGTSAFGTFLALVLTVISCIFYPYSLYWYKDSLIGNILNSIYYIGGFWSVIGKVLATLIGGIIIAGVLSPITGIATWRKYKKLGKIIGEEKDFR